MLTIVVTGAAGVVGQRAVRRLVEPPLGADGAPVTEPARVIALDQDSLPFSHELIEAHRTDLLADDLGHHLVGADRVIHLAEDSGRRGDAGLAEHMLNRVLDGADAAQCSSLIVLSSATVYGAHADNPVPMSESQPARPIEALDFAIAKHRLELQALAWAEETGGALAILRPTTTLSEDGASWVATAMRAATTVRPDQVDPPVQFLHHDDLAAALCCVATKGGEGLFNVAPDGWIGPELFAELVGGVQLRVPSGVNDLLLDLGRRFGWGQAPIGIEPYVRHPWVIANDRLRSIGWSATHTNEEAFIAGTPPPPWSVTAQRRQELALGAAALGVAGAMAAAAAVTRRLVR